MTTLGIDIETYSETDLKTCGVYKYVQDPAFEILLFAYSVDGGAVEVVDLKQGEKIPDEIGEAIIDRDVVKTAFNANFERTALARWFNWEMDPVQWACTMAKASLLGLPLSLEAAAMALKVEAKADGKALIKYFTVPCKPTKVNGGRTRNLPQHAPEKWEQFKEYNRQDVVSEQAVLRKLLSFEVPAMETKLWQIDQQINDTGILVDPAFVKNAIRMSVKSTERLTKEITEITRLDNPNSVSQLKSWLSEEMGMPVGTLNKEAMPELLDAAEMTPAKRVLEIRQEMGKTSVKKYVSMINYTCKDRRVRGLFQYYGANRTGRWAGRGIQVHNLPRNSIKDMDLARGLILHSELDMVDLLYGNVPDLLSQLIRTAFVAPDGHRLIVSDFSAIEARIIAWLAGESWRMQVFNTHGKIYEASAAQMFRIPIEQVTKDSEYRQKGKIAELALGYQGGPGALIAMGAIKMGLDPQELPRLVAMWRNANKKIVQYWYTVGDAAVECVGTGSPVTLPHGIKMLIERGVFFIQLPSGRRLAYLKPQLRPNNFNGHSIMYQGVDQERKTWGWQETYGGKLVENIVQAVARDVLADAMIRIHEAGYKIVLHVHDEIVSEMPVGTGSIEQVNKIMGTPIPWAKGLPLKAESFETLYYKKD